MVDRANIKQMIPALPDEKIGNYSRRVKKIFLLDSAPPSNAICFYCLFNNCIVLTADTGLEAILLSLVLYLICKHRNLCDFADMLAATSVLQQQAADIRNQRINWQSYLQ